MNKVKKERLKALGEVQKKRVGEFNKLRKKKTGKNALQNQLKKWKSKGYDTKVLENRHKIPEVSDMRKKVREWKSKGYDTKVLDKNI